MAKRNICGQSACGTFWFAGWLFTLGFVGPGFWKGLLALILWPYYLGAALTGAG